MSSATRICWGSSMHAPKWLWLSWIGVPLLTVANQACMKLLAERLATLPTAEALLSPYILGIGLCEVASFLLWLRVLAVVPVGRAVPISAVAYVLVLLLGWIGFGEPWMPVQIIGSVLILMGVFLLASPSHQLKEIPV